MPWLNIYLLQVNQVIGSPDSNNTPGWLKLIIAIAPVLALLAALSNLFLAFVVFKFTKRKNDNDRNIKWFQELVYAPNKETIFDYFKALHSIREMIPQAGELSEDQKGAILEFIKGERNKFMSEFVDLIKPISATVHQDISTNIDNVTDGITKAIDNDELKLNNPKTYQREIANKISASKNSLIVSLFNYTG